MNDINVQMRCLRLMTFNVINLTSLTFNVLCLIAISDDEYCLERDVTWRDVLNSTKYLCSNSVFLSTQLNFKLQEKNINKEINNELN
jgi:hypothetical protein